MPATVCDFQRSFMAFTVHGHENTARIQIDARCRVTNDGSTWREYVLITPCKSESMYIEDNLFQVPNYDFFGVFELGGDDPEYIIWRTHAEHDAQRAAEWEAGKSTKRFAEVDITIGTLPNVTVLNTNEEIVAATRRNHPIIARTRIAQGSRVTELEYLVKTMNIAGMDKYQVDTGPVLIPSWIRTGGDTVPRGPLAVEQLDAAFIVYNTRERAEFVIRQPTKISGSAVVWHYSEIAKTAAEHQFYAGV